MVNALIQYNYVTYVYNTRTVTSNVYTSLRVTHECRRVRIYVRAPAYRNNNILYSHDDEDTYSLRGEMERRPSAHACSTGKRTMYNMMYRVIELKHTLDSFFTLKFSILFFSNHGKPISRSILQDYFSLTNILHVPI